MKKIMIFLLLASMSFISSAQISDRVAPCPGPSCSANCLFTDCNVCCSAGAGGAACACSWGWSGCVCISKGENKVTQTKEQKINLKEFISKISNFQSYEGKQIIYKLNQISDLFGESETLGIEKMNSYDDLIKQYVSLVDLLSGEEKDLFITYYNEAKQKYYNEAKQKFDSQENK